MGRPPVKSTKACAMAKRKGELEAETKFWDKQPLTKKLKRLLWKKLEEIDALKLAAMAGTTYFVHGIILNSPELMEKASLYAASGMIFGAIGITITGIVQATGLFGEDTPKPALNDKIEYWMLSAIIAYLLIEHGGELAGMMLDGGKGIATLAKTLLA